jgi:hypothetical protein
MLWSMAKAQFHRYQKVWVSTVGTWATIERIVPIWAKGFDEPVRITYDLGLGREFFGHELQPEDRSEDPSSDGQEPWRLLRARNKWQQPEDCGHHPYPGSYPIVVTDAEDWGGWRVPGAEYDRDPRKIETQARLIAAAPQLLKIAREVRDLVAEQPEDAPADLQLLAKRCADLMNHIVEIPAPPQPPAEDAEAA